MMLTLRNSCDQALTAVLHIDNLVMDITLMCTSLSQSKFELTFSSLDGSDIPHQLIHCFFVFLLLHTIKHNASSCLEVRDSVLKRHGSDCNADVHHIICKIEPAHCASVNATFLFLETRYELNGLNFWCP